MPIQVHYQPNTRPLLPKVVAPLPTFAAGLTNVGTPAVMLKYARPDFVQQVRPTLATLPNLSSDLAKPAAPAVRLKYDPPTYIAPPKYNLLQAATPTVASWTPTIGVPAIEARYAPSDFVIPPAVTTTVLATMVAGLAEIGMRAVAALYNACRTDGQLDPTLETLPTFLPATLGAKAQAQDYSLPDFVMGAAADIAGLFDFLQLADPTPVAVELQYSKAADFVAPVRANIVPLAPPLAEPGGKAQALRYALADIVAQIAPAVATLPALIFGLAEQAANALPQRYDKGGVTSPDKFNIIAAAQTFLPGWLTTDGKLAVALRYLQSEAWVGQVQPTLVTLPTLLHGLIEVMRPANPPKFTQGPAFTAPEKFNIVAAAQTFLPGWMAVVMAPAVVLRYILPEALTRPLGVFTVSVSRTLGTPQEALGGITSTKTTNYEILAKILAAFGMQDEVLGSRASSKGTTQEALGTRQSPKGSNYEAKGTVVGVRGHNQEAKGFVVSTGKSAYEILATVAPRQAKSVYEVLRGVASARGAQQEASGKVFGIRGIPQEAISAVFNPVTLLGGRVFPLIGVLGGKVMQTVGVGSASAGQPVIGVLSAKVVQRITVAAGKVFHVLGILSGKIVD